jgi:hypothetical protein
VNRQKAKDALLVVSLIGLWLLMPPAITFFNRPDLIAGIPMIIVYIFGVWLALIVLTIVLSRRVRDDRDRAGPVSIASNPEDG